MAKVDPQRLIFGLFLIVLVLVGEVLLGHFKLPGWPAFMVMIFFIMEHMNKDKAPHILVGGLFGIVCLILLTMFRSVFAPMLGIELATLLFVAIFIFAIVAFGEMVPMVLNNYAFMFFTVAAGVATFARDAATGAVTAVVTAAAGAAGKAGGAAAAAAVVEAAKAPLPPPAISPVYIWMGVEVVVGAIFIAGILGIVKIMTAMAMKKAAAAKAAGG
jgi:hypothetical protein